MRLSLSCALIVSTLVASSASADEIWWVARGADDLWNTDRNWVTRVSREFTIPDGEEPVYLSGLPAALIDDTFTSVAQTAAQTANFYVGGWGPSLDSFRGGDPTGYLGVLDVTGGELDVNGYIRLGIRGTGTINQSGGTVTSVSQITMGWLSTNSSGTYNLSGGIIDAPSLGIGVHGTGTFNMTGGLVDRTSRSIIGKGFAPAGVFPASGVMNQSGGIFQTQQLYIGDSDQSVGVLHLEDDALLKVATRFVTGVHGSGSITQDGGTIDLGWSLLLGMQPGAFGEYTITQGTFRQTDAAMRGSVLSGVHVGTKGTGAFNVMGSGGEVNIAGVYEQNGLSTLTIELCWCGMRRSSRLLFSAATWPADPPLIRRGHLWLERHKK